MPYEWIKQWFDSDWSHHRPPTTIISGPYWSGVSYLYTHFDNPQTQTVDTLVIRLLSVPLVLLQSSPLNNEHWYIHTGDHINNSSEIYSFLWSNTSCKNSSGNKQSNCWQISDEKYSYIKACISTDTFYFYFCSEVSGQKNLSSLTKSKLLHSYNMVVSTHQM